MGDTIYPAFILTGLKKPCSDAEVWSYLRDTIGTNSSDYVDGGPSFKFIHYSEENCRRLRLIIKGVNVPLRDLDIRLGHVQLGKTCVKIHDVDFNAPRDGNGLMDWRVRKLHDKLKEGQGFFPPLPIFRQDFIEKFGCVYFLDKDVYFDDVRNNVQTGYLGKNCRAIRYSNLKGKVWADSYQQLVKKKVPAHQVKCDSMELSFPSKIHALEAVCFLNKNPEFSTSVRTFITKPEGFKCQVQSMWISSNNRSLGLSELLRNLHYIPFERLNQGILDSRLHEKFSAACVTCRTKYKLLGIGPDLSWIAATCSCDTNAFLQSWKGEPFFRLFLVESSRNALRKYGSEAHGLKLEVLIQGMMPLYRDPFHFLHSAVAAYNSEFHYSRLELCKHQADSRVLESVHVENINVDDEPLRIYMCKLSVPKTKIWCKDGLLRMRRCTLVPLERERNGPGSFQHMLSYLESKSPEWVKGTILDIQENAESGNCTVTTNIQFAEGQFEFRNGQHVRIIPKPPTNEKRGIANGMRMWIRDFNERKLPITGKVSECVLERTIPWGKTQVEKNVWRVCLDVPDLKDEQLFMKSLEDSYVGAEIILSNNNVHWDYAEECRVVSILRQHKTMKVEIITVLPKDKEILPKSDAFFKMWMIGSDATLCHSLGAITLGEEFVYPSGNSEDDEEEYIDTPQQRFYYEENLVYSSPFNLNSVLSNWHARPYEPIKMFDFLQTNTFGYSHNPKITQERMTRNLCPEFTNSLCHEVNESQLNAIQNFENNRISFVIGPPGTGKSWCAAYGIATLYCKEEGLIVVTSPSNFATDEIYEKIRRVNENHHLEMEIRRMLAPSRETQDLCKNPDDLDPLMLHVEMTRHSDWRADAEVNAILEKEARNGPGRLKRKEVRKLKIHKRKIMKKLLFPVDIVVCTVSTAGDNRISAMLNEFRKVGKPLGAIVFDEASLLQLPSTVPLLCLNSTRIWVLGDPNQLRPNVQCEAAKNACLDVSLMEMLFLTDYVQENKLSTLLNVQYRMPETLASIVSSFMYDSRVQSSDCVVKRNYLQFLKLYQAFPEMKNKNVAWYTYNRIGEVTSQSTGSKGNLTEVEITADILRKLQNCQIKMKDVTIISMYENHINLLRRRIQSLGKDFKNVEVVTCDSWQGKEGSIIILNTVRSNKKNAIGFLSDAGRLNVSISRAMDFLFVVGDAVTLRSSGTTDMIKLFDSFANENTKIVTFDTENAKFPTQVSLQPMREFLCSHGFNN